MVGSPAIAAWIALWGFWILLLVGWIHGELGYRSSTIFIWLWLIGFVSLRYLPNGAFLFLPYVAVFDVALVFAIFKGDVRLT